MPAADFCELFVFAVAMEDVPGTPDIQNALILLLGRQNALSYIYKEVELVVALYAALPVLPILPHLPLSLSEALNKKT